MSDENQKHLKDFGAVANWGFKIVIAICAYLLADNFKDMKDDVKAIGKDTQLIKESVIRVEDRTERNTGDIGKIDSRVEKLERHTR
jgi:hypothetical protein